MEKEYWVLVAVSFFVLSSVLESFAGAVQLEITSPLTFLSSSYLSTYPLTAAAIGVRALALLISALLAVSLIEKQYFAKAVILLAAGVVAELYAVQQLATEAKMIPIQWTLSFAYAGMGAVPLILYFVLRGTLGGLRTQLTGAPEEEEGESQKRIDKIRKLSKD